MTSELAFFGCFHALETCLGLIQLGLITELHQGENRPSLNPPGFQKRETLPIQVLIVLE